MQNMYLQATDLGESVFAERTFDVSPAIKPQIMLGGKSRSHVHCSVALPGN